MAAPEGPNQSQTPTGGGGPPAAPAREGAGAYTSFRIKVEFLTKTNNNTLCPITKRMYRGRWSNSVLKNRVPDDRFANMPDLPGIQLIFDGAQRKVVIHDPLSRAHDLRKEAQRICKEMGWPKPDANNDVTYDRLGEDQMKNWLYWFRRWVDCDQVSVESGAVPPMEEIERLPGKVRYHVHDTSPAVNRYPSESELRAAGVPPYVSPTQAAGVKGDG